MDNNQSSKALWRAMKVDCDTAYQRNWAKAINLFTTALFRTAKKAGTVTPSLCVLTFR